MKNKYPLSLRDWFRFRVMGNRFTTRQSIAEAMRGAAAIIGLLAVYGFIGEMDYREELRIEAARAADIEAVLLACMNGEAKFMNHEQTEAVVCEKAWATKI